MGMWHSGTTIVALRPHRLLSLLQDVRDDVDVALAALAAEVGLASILQL